MRNAFANILFSGACNAKCPYCIGKDIRKDRQVGNLGSWPLPGLEAFIDRVRQCGITQISLTGTNTDPQLYRHEEVLIGHLRASLPGVKLSLHTNGRLLLVKNTFALYDRMCVSIPSFHEATYTKMMGVPGVVDIGAVVRQSRIPIKLSCIVTPDNRSEIQDYLERAGSMGIRRIVFRKPFGSTEKLERLVDVSGFERLGNFFGNPVFQSNGVEVTLWDFSATECSSVNLFADGTVWEGYALVG
jgi:MoaA/NifB/PqqE/SkfB family radical SAM enzyme